MAPTQRCPNVEDLKKAKKLCGLPFGEDGVSLSVSDYREFDQWRKYKRKCKDSVTASLWAEEPQSAEMTWLDWDKYSEYAAQADID